MKNIIILLVALSFCQMFSSCKTKSSAVEDRVPVVSVKATSIRMGDIESNVILNGQTIYLRKNTVVSPISGYVVRVNVRFGDAVRKNDLLFEIQTRESKALENTNTLNGNAGLVKITAPAGGTVSGLNINETDGYIVEGGTLCTIVEDNDLAILMNVPFHYNTLVKKDLKCKIILPDNSLIDGYVFKILPFINEVSQTRDVLIKTNAGRNLPENLNLLVQITGEKHNNSFLIAKSAILSNEAQTEFWVMKITGETLAIRVPVLRGIQNDSIVEISSPYININDLLISEGAYSLEDSTVVKIEK